MTKASAKIFAASAIAEPSSAAMELVCTVNSMTGLRAAIDHGADCVRIEHSDTKSAHGFSGMSFDNTSMIKGIRYAHDKRRKVLLELDTESHPSNWEYLRYLIDGAARSGIDAVILSDFSLMLYTIARHPDLRLHYIAQESALNHGAINFLQKQFGVSRVMLPRVLSLAQIRHLAKNTKAELEVFGFGRLCTLVEGYETALPNRTADMVERIIPTTMHVDAPANFCAIDELACNDSRYSRKNSRDINTLRLLPQLAAMDVRAICVEGFDHGPVHLAQVIKVWREAIDDCLENCDHYAVKPTWITELNKFS